MIGQEKIQMHLNTLIMCNNFPRFLLLIGAAGSGKKMLAHRITRMMGVEYEFMDNQKVDDIRNVIEASLTLNRAKIYIFPDIHNMNTQAQNALLKTLEEPPTNAYFIMTAKSVYSVLSTIRSRAFITSMDAYSKEELRNFTEDEELLKICSNPGQIKRYQQIEYGSLIEHCKKVADVLGRVNLANVFNVLKSVKEEDYDLIIPTLQYVFGERLSTDEFAVKKLRIIQETSLLLEMSATVNVRNALEMMLVKLWEVS